MEPNAFVLPPVLLLVSVRPTLLDNVNVPVNTMFLEDEEVVIEYPVVLTVRFPPVIFAEPDVPSVIVPAAPARIPLFVPFAAAAQVPWAPVAETVRQAFVVLQFPVPPAAGFAAVDAPFQ